LCRNGAGSVDTIVSRVTWKIHSLPGYLKAGLLLMTAEWFAQVETTGSSFKGLPQMLNEDAACIEALAPEIGWSTRRTGHARPDMAEAVDRFQREAMVPRSSPARSPGADRRSSMPCKKCPSALAAVVLLAPRRLPEGMTASTWYGSSGPVGALQASRLLKRLGKRFGLLSARTTPGGVRRTRFRAGS
jgi:hypothetical protein